MTMTMTMTMTIAYTSAAVNEGTTPYQKYNYNSWTIVVMFWWSV